MKAGHSTRPPIEPSKGLVLWVCTISILPWQPLKQDGARGPSTSDICMGPLGVPKHPSQMTGMPNAEQSSWKPIAQSGPPKKLDQG